jgi:DNA polymerase I-like protein with 3'-5' exonuclease and polymerase domains
MWRYRRATMSDIRKYFESRYVGGKLVELDFSQLEIYVLAHLSGDKQLKADLLSGDDLHNISATMLYGTGFTPKQRRIAKTLSFQLQYGAGAKSMADTNGIPLSTAKKFIENYYNRYPKVKEFQDNMIETIEMGRQLSSYKTNKGYPAGISKIYSQTGRAYTFIEQDLPDFMTTPKGGYLASKGRKLVGFSPTQAKNYFVQGCATGDIMPMVLGKLMREVIQNGDVDIVCTVHDSVVFDCFNEGVARPWAKKAKEIMELAPTYYEETFGVKFDLPLHASVEMGDNWHEMKELTF